MKKYKYKIRAHHGMCLAFFKGKGYSNEFTKNMSEIKNSLESNPLVLITTQIDDICVACPNNKMGICETNEKVVNYDKSVLSLCGIHEDTIMPFLSFEKLVYDNILLAGKREEICGDCQWSKLCHFKEEL